jgi:hypothetical protein
VLTVWSVDFQDRQQITKTRSQDSQLRTYCRNRSLRRVGQANSRLILSPPPLKGDRFDLGGASAVRIPKIQAVAPHSWALSRPNITVNMGNNLSDRDVRKRMLALTDGITVRIFRSIEICYRRRAHSCRVPKDTVAGKISKTTPASFAPPVSVLPYKLPSLSRDRGEVGVVPSAGVEKS